MALYLTDTSGKRRAVAVPMVRASFVVGMVDEAAFKMRVFLEKNVPTVAGVSGLERHGKAARSKDGEIGNVDGFQLLRRNHVFLLSARGFL